MGLPKAIQKQVEEADRIVMGVSGEQPEPVEGQQPAPLEQPQAPAAAPSQPSVPEATWEHKYSSLKGMYDANVPRLHAEVRDLTTQMRSMIEENARLKAQPATAAPAPVQATLITDKDREAFGPDLLEVMERVAAQATAGVRLELATVRHENEQLKGNQANIASRQGTSSKELFEIKMDTLSPDWRTQNNDQQFLNWLAEVDEVYGIPRSVSLQTAYERLDADRVAAVFNAFRKLTAPSAPAKPAAAQELQRQIAPTRTRAAPAPQDQGNKPIWTQAQVTRFYDDWRKGLVSDVEAQRYEQDIHAAIAEGRIR